MELHLHLSYAFRSLDRKWGTPIDLEDESVTTCAPAIVDIPTTTFSSEEYLRTLRPKRVKKKRCDSFSNISISRISSTEELDFNVSEETIICDIESVETMEKSGNKISSKKWKLKNIVKNLKLNTIEYLEKKFKKET